MYIKKSNEGGKETRGKKKKKKTKKHEEWLSKLGIFRLEKRRLR